MLNTSQSNSVKIYGVTLSTKENLFLDELEKILSDDPLEEDYFLGDYLLLPRLTDIQDRLHAAIVEHILKKNAYLSGAGRFSAFFHGYIFKESYLKFRELNQKLNLSMNVIYSLKGQEVLGDSSTDKDLVMEGVAKLLRVHLRKMLDNTALFGSEQSIKMGGFIADLYEASGTRVNVTRNNGLLVVSLDAKSAAHVNKKANEAALEIQKATKDQDKKWEDKFKKYKEEINVHLEKHGIAKFEKPLTDQKPEVASIGPKIK